MKPVPSRGVLAVVLAAAPVTASAAPVSAPSAPDDPALEVGVGLGVSTDLPDPSGHTRFAPGPQLRIPVRYRIAEHAWLRAGARFDLATGSDRITWDDEVNGHPVRVYDDDHFTMLLAGALTAGVDVEIPLDAPVVPYLGSDLGVAWVGTYHSLGGPTQHLLDPEQNDLDNPNNVDPYTTQAAFLTDLHLGAAYPLSDTLAVALETGYSMAFLDARPLEKAPHELSARREPYGWNAFRVGVDLRFRL